jgi:non-ribosomal peptide synthetase-like protein
VIYTSGSTGGPKGVIVEHRNATGFVRSLSSIYGLNDDDRVYQGFSVAFDASIEEIWAAFSLGGTLVVPPEPVANSPTDVADFLTRERITFFSTVPTFLSMIKADLSTVRLLVVGGEPCPPDLVTRWAPGRRMLNTYGPTEATVVATAGECIAGKPVTIGRAIAGYTTHVLDEQLCDVAAGVVGELFIGGAGVTRGYVNQPELTAERFIPDRFDGHNERTDRLFRTHDLVRKMTDGSLQFVGRSDGLVKIRGFRIELSEVEAALIEHPSIQVAAVTVLRHGDLAELAAFVVLERAVEELNRREILEFLRQRLPDYMVPRYLDPVDRLPQLTSGKVNRKLLPIPRTLLTSSDRESIPPATPVEREIVQILEKCFAISPVFASDDFFRDLNGHSLLAARVVTELRAKFGTTRISVRDLYEHRTACHLASHLKKIGVGDGSLQQEAAIPSGETSKRPIAKTVPLVGRAACAFAQAVMIILFHAAITTPVVFFLIVLLDVSNGRIELWRAAEDTSTAALLVWPSWLLLSIAVKWIVIGRYKPGKYRLWGLYYLRWWIVTRFQSLSWSGMFVGTPLMTAYYRAMGANVGPNCTINTALCAAFDLITIGRGTSIGSDTQILGYRVEDGWLILGNIEIGRDCFIGMHCNLGLDVAMGDGAWLDDMSLLADGAIMKRGESRRGAPAETTEERFSVLSRRAEAPQRGLAFGLIHLALIYAMGYLLIFAILPSSILVIYALFLGSPAYCIASILLAIPLAGALWLVIVLCVKGFAIGHIRPGIYPLSSRDYVRMWFLKYLLDNTRNLLVPIYATMLLPNLLRILGAKIGRGAEISTVMHIMPDLLEIGDESFLADACIVGGFRIHRGWVEILPSKIGNRTFVGNSALAPAGIELGSNSLLGVMSTPPLDQARSPDATRWLGSPSFQLPNTEHAEGFAENTTYCPGSHLVLFRGAMETLKILLPACILAVELAVFLYVLSISYASYSPVVMTLIAPFLSIALAFSSVVAIRMVKQILIGTFVPTVKPLWCSYIWSNEIINGAYESLAANAMSPLLGTPFIAPCLRLLGCTVGRWVFLETTLFSEFDLVKIGDYAALNLGATIQTHLFEDRVMKSDVLEIGDHCSIGNMAVILYGAKMQRGSTLGPLSLLMKGETLPAFSRWYGIPTKPIPAPPLTLRSDSDRTRSANATGALENAKA